MAALRILRGQNADISREAAEIEVYLSIKQRPLLTQRSKSLLVSFYITMQGNLYLLGYFPRIIL